MIKNRYFKSLLGTFAEILVGKNVVYATQATYADFVASAPVGTVGVYNAATNALVTAAVAANTEIFIAVKRAKSVLKTAPFKTGVLAASKTPYLAAAKQVSTIATAAGATVAAGDILEVLVTETTATDLRLENRQSYYHKVTAGQTLAQAITALVDNITKDNKGILRDASPVADAAVVNADDITLTAKEFGVHFTVTLRGKLAEIATVSTTTAMILGSGTKDNVKELAAAGKIAEGITTNYPEHGNSSEYDTVEDFVDATEYDVFNFGGIQDAKTPLPSGQQHQPRNIILAVPKGVFNADANLSFNPSNKIATIFGLTLNA